MTPRTRLRTVAALSAMVAAIAVGLVIGRGGLLRRRAPEMPPSTPRTTQAPLSSRRAIDAGWSELSVGRAPTDAKMLFWEAEQPARTNYPENNPFRPLTPAEANALSGGAWIGAEQPRTSYFLEYELELPAAGTYRFYARKFWKHGPFRYRFDDAPFVSVGSDIELLDETNLREHVVVNWTQPGTVELAAGRHRLRIELSPDDEGGASAWDAFLLTTEPFSPRGKLRPGEPWPAPPEGFFTFDPGLDASDGSVLDLRFLNHRAAGDGGPIVGRGSILAAAERADPTRFWGVNATGDVLAFSTESMLRMARGLAKRGVNLVRLQARLWRDEDFTRLDERKLERVHQLAAALRVNGIYLALSIYFPLWLEPDARSGLAGYEGDTQAFGLAFFEPKLEEIYRGWWTQLLTPPNPATGRSLAADPALALVELINEDSLLFHTFEPYGDVPAAQMARLERAFGRFLEGKYGSVAAALLRFGGMPIRGDAAHDGRVGLLPPSEIVRWRTQRARDTAAFLNGLMRSFYERSAAHVRALGFRGSVICSNWVTADARVLGPLDKWANTACDVMDRHGYHSGPHVGAAASYDVRAGDRYGDASALRYEGNADDRDASALDLPFTSIEYDGKPMVVSEFNWVEPNRFRAEAPFLAAAYGSLQGVDAFAFFALDTPGFSTTLGKFSVADPLILGQFPAFALVYRKGYLREAPAVARARLGLSDLGLLRGAPFVAPPALDQLRASEPSNVPSAGDGTLDPRTFLVGKVTARFVPQETEIALDPLARFIDEERGTVTSSTGELVWDARSGLATMRAPRVQGLVGFTARAGVRRLGDVDVELLAEYGSLVVVSLDGEPLARSKKMLVQVVSEAQNSGWSAPGDAVRPIVSIGHPPILVREIKGSVTFRRPDVASLRATALDHAGRPARTLASLELGLPLLPDVLYYLVDR
jgi:hypothetical protein